MAYSEDDKKKLVDSVCELIESGLSLRKSLKAINLQSTTFYSFIDSDEEKRQQYARACEERAEVIADEIIEISDNSQNDTITTDDEEIIVNHENIQRSKLRVDSRKWLLGKLAPKKYGDSTKLVHEGNSENPININSVHTITLPDGTKLDNFSIE